MKSTRILLPSFCSLLLSCGTYKTSTNTGNGLHRDSLSLVHMVNERAKAMEKRDIASVMAQFSDDATFINSAGYYLRNKAEIEMLHNSMPRIDTLGYYYRPGKVQVRMLDEKNALVYYPWRTGQYRSSNPKDTVTRNFGLLTISAQKRNGKWLWVAVTNQRIAEYFDDLKRQR